MYVYLFMILNNMLSVSLRNKIVRNENQRLMRQAGNIVLGLWKTKSAQESVFYEGIKMHNSIKEN